MKLFKSVLPLFLLSDINASDLGAPPPFADKVSVLRDRITELGNIILFSQDPSENAVVSPMSLGGALFLLAAATDGTAQSEVGRLLGINVNDAEPYESYTQLADYLQQQHNQSYMLNIANGIFYQTGYSPTMGYGENLRTLESDSSDIKETNFASGVARDEINGWVNDKTKGKIPELFADPIDPNTIAMILSSLYFKASWQVPFEMIRWKGAYCWRSDTACDEDIPFMSVDNQFPVYWGDDFIVVDVPMTLKEDSSDDSGPAPAWGERETYHSKIMTFQMWIPMGVLSTSEDHQEFYAKIRREAKDVRSQMQTRRINLVMPKMSLEFNADLSKQFQLLGIETVFEYGKHFTPLFGADNDVEAALSEIRHAVKLDIDEDGIEGAATTAIGMMFRSMPPDVVANKPFYFSIAAQCRSSEEYDYDYEVSENECPYDGTPIFLGKVVNPAPPK